MKKASFFLTLIALILTVSTAAFSQTDEITQIGTIPTESFVSRMVWNDTGDMITLVSRDSVNRITVSEPAKAENYTLKGENLSLTTLSESGLVVSTDWNNIYLYEPGSGEKAVRIIEPGFMLISVSVSDDGTLVLADSAEEIRTVVYNADNGKTVYDLGGFSTAAPVYDSILSDDGRFIIWHSRGTFAVQNAETGEIGETVSLWDFASSYALSPDNGTLAVGIINEDYENGTVIFFAPDTAEETGRTILGQFSPHELAYSADGSLLLAADTTVLYRIDPESFELLGQLTLVEENSGDLRISRIAVSPDGTSAAVLLSNGELYLIRNQA